MRIRGFFFFEERKVIISLERDNYIYVIWSQRMAVADKV